MGCEANCALNEACCLLTPPYCPSLGIKNFKDNHRKLLFMPIICLCFGLFVTCNRSFNHKSIIPIGYFYFSRLHWGFFLQLWRITCGPLTDHFLWSCKWQRFYLQHDQLKWAQNHEVWHHEQMHRPPTHSKIRHAVVGSSESYLDLWVGAGCLCVCLWTFISTFAHCLNSLLYLTELQSYCEWQLGRLN